MDGNYLIYLRKSRKDLEAEQAGQGETLARHRKILHEFAAANRYNVAKEYEEVVSGDSVAARPKMQELLKDVETGMYDGVIVMEVERLSRGDGFDQALISRTFQYSGTKIITPMKTYDPANDIDAEFLGLGLFMSRHEYNTIKRRLLDGRTAAEKEGKWSHGSAPFGYDIIKAQKQKGHILSPNKDAGTVKLIFSLFVNGLSYAEIQKELSELHIASPNGNAMWIVPSIKALLKNPVYAGYIRSNFKRQKKSIVNGEVILSIKKVPQSEWEIYDGQHEPIVSRETFEIAQRMIEDKNPPVKRKVELKNPLAKIIHCSFCGSLMYSKNRGKTTQPSVYCPRCSSNVGSFVSEVEKAVLSGLQQWIPALETDEKDENESASETAFLRKVIDSCETDLGKIERKKTRAFELVEEEVYDITTFKSRMEQLSNEEAEIAEKLRLAKKRLNAIETESAERKLMLPKVKSVLSAYSSAKTIAEKNKLLRSILARVDYKKTRRSYTRDGSDMEVVLYPLFTQIV